MEIDLNLLEYLTTKGSHYLQRAVVGTTYLPRTVSGVATFLLDHDGNVDLLTGKQQVTYARFLQPLLFDVACQGATGKGDCAGNGRIAPEQLVKCYRDEDFRCSHCRGDETD